MSESSDPTPCQACKDAFQGVTVHQNDQYTEKVKSTHEKQRGKEGKTVLDHFVTVRGLEGDVILEAKFADPNCCDLITWNGATGGAVNNDKCTASVSRAGTTQGGLDVGQRIDVSITCNGTTIWSGVVWVVWANASITVPEPPAEPVLVGAPAQNVVTNGGKGGGGFALKLFGEQNPPKRMTFTFQITPKDMFDVTKDIPDLKPTKGKKALDAIRATVPGKDEPHILTKIPLSQGVEGRWDATRQIRAQSINPQRFHKDEFPKTEGTFYDVYEPEEGQQVADKAIHMEFPEGIDGNKDPKSVKSINPVGNDDFALLEDNNPYSQKNELQGLLTAQDSPQFPIRKALGETDNTFELRFHAREFARLMIVGKWFKISNPTDDAGLWRVHFKVKKQATGDWADDGSTFDQNNSGWDKNLLD